MDDPSPLFEQWHGQIVSRTFNGGFVTLSFVVSLIGAVSTLELINRRTAPKGMFNHLLLVSAAVTMGGIAIWCMHYIGNRAITMASGEEELQIAYSSGFTALSFFVPIGVLLGAFIATGTNNRVPWWRIAAGGLLAGAAICGMHYLGNSSISNYKCSYTPVNVVGAALIAVAASMVSLSLFFTSRASWTNSWWKRGASSTVLAGAVSGMHWCASMGTEYELIALKTDNGKLSRDTTVIVVICLSISACFVVAGTMVYTATKMNSYKTKAQQVVLATAVFDEYGCVMVSPDGLLPSEKITESFLEKGPQDSFSIAHPLFQWMFQASRNWESINNLVGGMLNHLAHLPRIGARDASRGSIRLTGDNAEPVENYRRILQELFCAAALSLAERTRSPLDDVGIVWDEILPTGNSIPARLIEHSTPITEGEGTLESRSRLDEDSLAEKGMHRTHAAGLASGSLLFLVRRVSSPADIAKLEAAGFRFADPLQVSGIIARSMQIQRPGRVHSKLRSMARYANENAYALEPGLHLAFFGVRARVSVDSSPGFDVLVRRDARNLLPSAPVFAVDGRLELWQLAFLHRLDGLKAMGAINELENMHGLLPKEAVLATQLVEAIKTLRQLVDDPIMDEAKVACKVFNAPCRCRIPRDSSSSRTPTAALVAFQVVVPIHHNMASPRQKFIPLSLFKAHQLVAHGSPHKMAFARAVHRDISPLINSTAALGALESPRPGYHMSGRSFLRRASDRLPRTVARTRSGAADGEGSSVAKLWNVESRGSSGDMDTRQPGSFGGIMVSQEITVDVDVGAESRGGVMPGPGIGPGKVPGDAGPPIEMKSFADGPGYLRANVEAGKLTETTLTFVDELFNLCVEGR